MRHNLRAQLEFCVGSLFCSVERNDFHTSCLCLDKIPWFDSSIQRMNSPTMGGGNCDMSLKPGVEMWQRLGQMLFWQSQVLLVQRGFMAKSWSVGYKTRAHKWIRNQHWWLQPWAQHWSFLPLSLSGVIVPPLQVMINNKVRTASGIDTCLMENSNYSYPSYHGITL